MTLDDLTPVELLALAIEVILDGFADDDAQALELEQIPEQKLGRRVGIEDGHQWSIRT